MLQARDDGLVSVDMGPPELDGPKVPTTLPTNSDGVVLSEPIQVTAVDQGLPGLGCASNVLPCLTLFRECLCP